MIRFFLFDCVTKIGAGEPVKDTVHSIHEGLAINIV